MGCLLALIVLAIGGVLGVKRNRLSRPGIHRGGLGFLVCLLGAGAGAGAVSLIIWKSLGYAAVYRNGLFFVAALILGLALFLLVYLWFRRWAEWEELAFGALSVWAVLLVHSTIWFRGGSFLFL